MTPYMQPLGVYDDPPPNPKGSHPISSYPSANGRVKASNQDIWLVIIPLFTVLACRFRISYALSWKTLTISVRPNYNTCAIFQELFASLSKQRILTKMRIKLIVPHTLWTLISHSPRTTYCNIISHLVFTPNQITQSTNKHDIQL